MSAAPTVALAEGFAPPDRAQWVSQVERTLKGAPLESLTRRTLEGLPIAPFYEGHAEAARWAKTQTGWEPRSQVRHGGPADANAQALAELAGGAQSLLLRLDPSGERGISAGSPDDLSRTLEGVLLDAASVALDAGFLGPAAADWLSAATKGAPAARLAFHLDPLSAFAEAGRSPGPIEAHLIGAANLGARLAQTYPRSSLCLASGRVIHEAGGGEAAELATALAAGLAYAKALTRAGMSAGEAFDRIVVGLAVDADYFLGIAKLRAARQVWARMATACGASGVARIEARSSARMLTRADPWTNMIRLTAAAFAGAVGGADVVVLGTFTDALGAPTAFARRQARNVQLVLAEEAHVGRVADPAAGSGFIEGLTAELADAAWTRFQEIESAGGVVKALEVGLIAGWAETGRAELSRRLKAKELRLLGVTDFPAADQAPVETDTDAVSPAAGAPSPALPGPDGRCPPLTPTSLESLA